MSTESAKAHARRYYEKHRDAVLARNREWAQKHPEVFVAAGRKYREKNRDLIRARARARNAGDRPKAAARARRAIATNPQFRIRNRCRAKLGRAIRNGNPTGSVAALIGCTIEQMRLHLERQFKPGMTWENYGEWHIDHIQPISGFDLTDADQLAAAWHFSNTCPLWGHENRTKGARRA